MKATLSHPYHLLFHITRCLATAQTSIFQGRCGCLSPRQEPPPVEPLRGLTEAVAFLPETLAIINGCGTTFRQVVSYKRFVEASVLQK